MKKRSIKNLLLNKTVVSSLSIKGALAAGESLFNTVCPFCNTDKDLCVIIREEE